MARGPATFRERDVTAAIRAAIKAGQEVYRVEIGKGGEIRIITSREAVPATPAGNPWDEVFDEDDVALRSRIP